MGKKYYAVAKGRKIGIFSTWEECKKQVYGFSKPIYKKFGSLEEAKFYICNLNGGIEKKEIKIFSEKKIKSFNKNETKKRICLLCSKPVSTRCELCTSCRRRKRELVAKLNENSNGREIFISNKNLVYLKEKYPSSNVFELLEKDQTKYFEALRVNKVTKSKVRSERKRYLRENTEIDNNEKVPDFVYTLLGQTKEVIKVSGERANPNIIYKCKRCGETLYTNYNEYRLRCGHDCSGIKSLGELIVEEFLKKHEIKYKTQRNTLKCVDPDTNSIMPYDFELVGKKVLIEVQGEQHKKYIPRFHVTIEGFEYQRKKDLFKKKFAQSQGYKLIEIWYEDLIEEKLSYLLKEYIN